MKGSELSRNHVRFGWLALAGFAIVGITLEAFHGFKTGWYLEEAYETRRLLFTLGHAHGALLSIVNVVFGVATAVTGGEPSRLRWASRLLTIATILLPAGFLIGGFGIHGSDPGVGIYLVPFGAACAVGAFLAAAAASRSPRTGSEETSPKQEPAHPERRKQGAGRRRQRS